MRQIILWIKNFTRRIRPRPVPAVRSAVIFKHSLLVVEYGKQRVALFFYRGPFEWEIRQGRLPVFQQNCCRKDTDSTIQFAGWHLTALSYYLEKNRTSLAAETTGAIEQCLSLAHGSLKPG